MSDAGTIVRVAEVMSDLVKGRSHDRRSLAYQFGITVASADRYINALAIIPGVVVFWEGRTRLVRFDRDSVPWHRRRDTAATATKGG
jgi:hypothetical protein